MPGTIVRPIPKQLFDGSGILANNFGTVYTAKAIDVSQFVEASVVLRIHSAAAAGGTGFPALQLMITTDAPTAEDPAVDFFDGPFVQIPTLGMTGPVPAAGTTVLTTVTTPFGGFLRLRLRFLQGTTVWTTLNATVRRRAETSCS